MCEEGVPNAQLRCIGTELFYFDSCGKQGAKKVCDDADPCTLDGCEADACAFSPRPDGAECGAGKTCQGGVCSCKPAVAYHCLGAQLVALDSCGMPGEVKETCDDANPCTVDGCQDDACLHAPVADGAVCGPGQLCTSGVCACLPDDHKGCDGGDFYSFDSCGTKGHLEQACQTPDPCTEVGCSPTGCTFEPAAEGKPCGGGKQCWSGFCQQCSPSASLQCWDNALYHYDSCGHLGALAASCDDGEPCTEDVCAGDVCLHTPVADATPCGAGNVCTKGTCGPALSCPPSTKGPALVAFAGPGGAVLCVDATEVTRGQYQAFLDATAAGTATGIENLGTTCSWNTSYVPGCDWPPGATPSHPIVCIDWCDAYAFCAWAGKRLCGKIGGGPASYPNAGQPSESQWMAACSANGERAYPYGGEYKKVCNDSNAAVGKTVAVGTYSACQGGPLGVFDMSGNVAEWEDACQGPEPTASCRIRGGQFYTGGDGLRCDGGGVNNDTRNDSGHQALGFRCCGP